MQGERAQDHWQSWNPVTGCTKVSEGCRHCYAERFAERWRGIAGHPYEHGFDLQLRHERLESPLRWRKPRRVFVQSMGDLFHEGVDDAYIAAVFAVIERTPRHTYQLVTKRAARLASLASALPWPANLCLGVTVEHAATARRVDALRTVPAAVRWICAEPLLGPLDDLDLTGIDFVVAGAESGPARRPRRPEWVAGLAARCAAAGVAFHDKQAPRLAGGPMAGTLAGRSSAAADASSAADQAAACVQQRLWSP
jgi:protein gp37